MRRVISLLLAASALVPMHVARAGTLYRCEASGVVTYSGNRIGGASCRSMGNYHTDGQPMPKVAMPAATAQVAKIDTLPSGAPTINVPDAATRQAASARVGRRVSGQVYSYIRNGVRYVTSTPPRGYGGQGVQTIRYSFIERCFACDAAPSVNFGTLRLNRAAYSNEIAQASHAYGVDEAIVRAIIHAESAFNPRALSRVGAQGLMQLMPATARRFGVANAFDAGQNIQGGVQYLAWLLKRYDGDLSRVAAGYNAGEGAVDKYGGVPPYSETRLYVQRVRTLADRYRSGLAVN